MNRYDEIMAHAATMSCTHQHIRATECPICRKEYEAIVEQAQREADSASEEGK